MRLWKSWIVTQKDLSVFKKNKYVLYSLVAMPIIMGVVLPVIFIFALNSQVATLPHAQLLAAANQVVNIATMYLVLIAVNSSFNYCFIQFCGGKNREKPRTSASYSYH